MNYEKVYHSIINKRIKDPLSKSVYGEKHHIIPRSIGGSNLKENLVRLSAREHFICHALLAEMYPFKSYEWYKMNHAFLMMQCTGSKTKRYTNSRLFEQKRKDFSIVMSFNQSGSKNSQFGTKKSPETRLKISRSLTQDKPSKRKVQNLRVIREKEENEKKNTILFKNLFEEFKNSNLSSIREFVRQGYYDKSHVALTKNFKKYVKEYNPAPCKPYSFNNPC